MRTHHVFGLVVTTVLLLGCSVGGSARRADPQPGDPWLGTQCSDGSGVNPSGESPSVATPPTVGAEQPIVLSVGSAGIWYQPLFPHSFVVYADGSAVRTEYSQNASLNTLTAGYVSMCAVEQAKRDIDRLSDVDFGSPQITDQNFVWIASTEPGQEAVELSVYAPGHEEELNRKQQNNRQQFDALWDGLLEAFVETGPYPAERIAIRASDEENNDAVDQAGEPWLDWSARPLSEVMDGQTCAVISGDEAASVAAELGSEASVDVLNPDENLFIEMAVVPPGVEVC